MLFVRARHAVTWIRVDWYGNVICIVSGLPSLQGISQAIKTHSLINPSSQKRLFFSPAVIFKWNGSWFCKLSMGAWSGVWEGRWIELMCCNQCQTLILTFILIDRCVVAGFSPFAWVQSWTHWLVFALLRINNRSTDLNSIGGLKMPFGKVESISWWLSNRETRLWLHGMVEMSRVSDSAGSNEVIVRKDKAMHEDIGFPLWKFLGIECLPGCCQLSCVHRWWEMSA